MQFYVNGGARCMTAGVGQAFLHDAVRRQFDAWIEGGRRSGDDEPQPCSRGVPGLVDQLVELLQARLGMPVRGQLAGAGGLGVLAQHAEQPPHFGQAGPGRIADLQQRLRADAADEGSALIGGRPYLGMPHPLSHVGALLDAAALQPSRSARNHLLWLAHSQGLGTKRVDEVIAQSGLGTAARRKAGGYSLGMRQRLGIAAAMLGDPPVLMLDEPFNGLDPEGIAWMRGFLRSLAAQGRAILVSSHLMSELQDTADHLVVVGRGQVIADTSVSALITAASGDRISVRTSARAQAMTVLAHAGATVAATGPDMLTVTGLAAETIIARLNDNSVPSTEISPHHATLEEAYMELTREAVEFRGTVDGEIAGEAVR
jgi:ABC-2 type transport system ATP-binding protein